MDREEGRRTRGRDEKGRKRRDEGQEGGMDGGLMEKKGGIK